MKNRSGPNQIVTSLTLACDRAHRRLTAFVAKLCYEPFWGKSRMIADARAWLESRPLPRRIGRALRAFAANTSGVTVVEYGIIVAGISIGVIVIAFLIGDDLAAVFEVVRGKIVSGISRLNP